MKSRAIIVVLVLALGAWIFVRVFRTESARPDALHVGAPLAPSEVAVPTADPGSAAVAPAAPPHSAAAVPDTRQALREEGCTILGRVIDDHGAALASVRVCVYASSGEWCPGRALGTVRVPYDLSGYETLSAADGTFALAVPIPTSDSIGGQIGFDPLYARDAFFLYEHRDTRMHPLPRRILDTGSHVLARTGAIRGRVLDTAGRPVARAHICLLRGDSVTDSTGRTDDAGIFTFGHLTLANYGLQTYTDDCWMSPRVVAEVQLGVVAESVDLRLSKQAFLAGRVRAEDGSAIAKAEIRISPLHDGLGLGSFTDMEGGFRICLPADDPHELSAHAEGFEPWDAQNGESHVFEPRTEDIEIVLRRSTITVFEVVDASTGEAVERFALAVFDPSSDFHSMYSGDSLRDYPGGRCERTAAPGKHRFQIRAPGHVPQEGDVRHEADGHPHQIIRLERGATVIGRAVFAGAPAVGLVARMSRGNGSQPPPATSLGYDDDWPVSGGHFDLSDFVGAHLEEPGTGSGVFRFTGVAAGTWRITLEASGAASFGLSAVKVGHDATLDLGELVLTAESVLRGRVLLANGTPPAGLEVNLGIWSSGIETRLDADGAFRFGGLSAGVCVLSLLPHEGKLDETVTRKFDLSPGETRDVVIDLR